MVQDFDMGSGHTRISPVEINDVSVVDEYTTRRMQGKLFRAISEQKFKLARILVEGGIDVNCSLRTGITPLMIACDQLVNRQWKRMQRHLIRALLLSNADVEAQDNFGRTALMYAYLTGDIQLIRLFEVHGSSATGIETITLSRRVPRHSVAISSNLGVHFLRWESVDFQDAIV